MAAILLITQSLSSLELNRAKQVFWWNVSDFKNFWDLKHMDSVLLEIYFQNSEGSWAFGVVRRFRQHLTYDRKWLVVSHFFISFLFVLHLYVYLRYSDNFRWRGTPRKDISSINFAILLIREMVGKLLAFARNVDVLENSKIFIEWIENGFWKIRRIQKILDKYIR